LIALPVASAACPVEQLTELGLLAGDIRVWGENSGQLKAGHITSGDSAGVQS
jgi:hypothetical protein